MYVLYTAHIHQILVVVMGPHTCNPTEGTPSYSLKSTSDQLNEQLRVNSLFKLSMLRSSIEWDSNPELNTPKSIALPITPPRPNVTNLQIFGFNKKLNNNLATRNLRDAC